VVTRQRLPRQFRVVRIAASGLLAIAAPIVLGAQGFRVRGMTIGQSSSGSGLQSVPHGPRRAGADGKWSFDLARVGGG
jgi:hypothetical protein